MIGIVTDKEAFGALTRPLTDTHNLSVVCIKVSTNDIVGLNLLIIKNSNQQTISSVMKNHIVRNRID